MKIVAALLLALTVCSATSYPLFKQCNSAWGSITLGHGPDTICRAGCLMSSVSMALNGHGKKINGATANPKNVNSWLTSHGGFQGDLFIWGSISSLGFKYLGKFNAATAATYLNQGKVVILNVRNGGHYVLATSHSGSTFKVNDPGFNVSSYTNSQVVTAAVFSVSGGFLQADSESINNFSSEQPENLEFNTENFEYLQFAEDDVAEEADEFLQYKRFDTFDME